MLLFVDNAASPSHLKLKNVELVFFPPNMTSQCQSLDQGIIQRFKKLYHRKLLRKAVSSLNADRDDSRQFINVLDVIDWVSSVTKNVQFEIVKKMFFTVQL